MGTTNSVPKPSTPRRPFGGRKLGFRLIAASPHCLADAECDSAARSPVSDPLPQPVRKDPIPWLRALKAEVQPTSFKKGREYAEQRRVVGMSKNGEKVVAAVNDGEGSKYSVELNIHADGVESACTCEAWNRDGPHCEHVVALALKWAARQRAVEQRSPETLSATRPGAQDASLPALAKVESWLGLSALPEYEFFYRIAQGQVGERRGWVVDVRRRDIQAQGPIHVKRQLASGARVAPADERVFVELAKYESRFDAKILLTDEELCALFPKLQSRKVIYRGTPLLFAEGGARPQVHLESTPEGAVATLEFRLPEGTTVSFNEALVLAGQQSYLIVGQQLFHVEPDLPPRVWRKWQIEPSMAFPPDQLDRVLSFFAAHLPRFELSFRADGIAVEENEPPHFILTLEGSPEHVLARLAARYGQSTVPVSPSAIHLGYATGGGGEGRKLYRRREVEEREAGQRLTRLGFRYDPAAQTYETAGDTAIAFWTEGLPTLPTEWERFSAQTPTVRVRPRIRPRIRVSMSGVQWFEVESEFVADDQSVDLGAVRLWLDSGRKYVPLKDGTYAEAERAELQRAADLLEEAGVLPGERVAKLPLYQAVAVDLLSSLGDTAEIEARARNALTELKGENGIPPIPLPKGLVAELRHYQQDGLHWLWFLHRHGLSGILADDMGLGKTIQALSLIQTARETEGPKPSLVVAPTSVLLNWQREAERFTPQLKVTLWHGQERRDKNATFAGSDLVLTSYALVRRDLQELSAGKFRYIILDEAQNIKNADSATAQACKSLPSEQRLALTGTPLENRLSELWSIFDFLMPGFLGTQDVFGDRYEQPIQIGGDMDARDRLKRRIQPFVLRRLKTEVAKDLPPKTDTVAYCEMEPGQAALYREILEESRRKVYDTIEKVGFKRSRVSILAALMKLRQVCCDPRLLKLPPGTLLPPSAKLERFQELTDDLIAEGHRALVFSQFTEMLELLKKQADERKITYQYLDGRTKDRMARVDAFNAGDGPPLFFISLKAGGTGLNLTAADYVIHYDPWWNPAVEDQATDRTHRIGQTKAVIAYKLITRGTVEEKILALQKRKRELAAGVLGTGVEFGDTLQERDIEDLFREAE
ncbi:MAG: SNF2-related protein [Myxococcaceae bacterium]